MVEPDPRTDGPGSLLYLGGIDLPMPQARAIQTLHTANGLAEQGWRVTLAVGRAPRQALRSVLTAYGIQPSLNLRVLSLPTVRLPHLPVASYVHPRLAVWNWSYGLSAVLALRALPGRWRPQLALARDPRLASLLLGARRITGCEVAYEVHELFSTRSRDALQQADHRPPTRDPRIRRLEEQVFTQAALLITLTACCKRLLIEEFGVPDERVIVAPDAVAAVPTSLPPRSARNRTIVYAGQLYPWKGVRTVVQALTLVPDARLSVVGGLENGDEHAASLRRLAGELGLSERVEFRGFVPHTQVARTIRDGAVAVVPLPDNPMSRYFTSPLKVFEYMAAGLPIVASDLPALREVLRHGQNALLVPPDDPTALAAALRQLLADPELAERLRSQAWSDVRGRTWSVRAQHISNALQTVTAATLNGKRGQRSV